MHPRLLVVASLALILSAPAALALRVGPVHVEAPLPEVALPAAAPVLDLPLEASAATAAPLLPAGPLAVPLSDQAAPGAPLSPHVPAVAPAPPAQAPPPAVAAAAGTGVLWVLIERLGLGRALAALYSRLSPSALLEHGRRERVLAMVRETPGIGPQAIADALGTGWGVTIYHLDKLEKAGLLASQRTGHHRCYFVPGAIPRDDQKTVALFRADTTRRVAQLVQQKPGLTQSQLANELGLSASAMSKQVAKLENAAMLRREASGEGQRLYPAPTLAALA